VVYGDTNSTLAGALAGAKLGLPVAHVEAGLRSFDRAMPEEVNRVIADHLSRWCLAPTPTAVANLAREGLTEGVVLVGDLMQDLAARLLPEIRDPAVLRPIAAELGAGGPVPALEPGRFLYATIHRAENRAPAALRAWAGIMARSASVARPVILALHPGTRAALTEAGITLDPQVRVVPPVGYRTSLALQLHAAAVLTDSGGIQREAAWLGTPCLVLRATTEWREAVTGSGGSMVIVGLDAARAAAAVRRLAPAADAPGLAATRAAGAVIAPAGAAAAIVDLLTTAVATG
ncbi:MAG TPA: UDP-N-acetylglucosamine 2-epimerase, partial [Candidatus Sulfotelmatobacter sp.]|nr:UDP-N-acetylglucosamine 2-epimerase [Candidatus Sulfotelmatobacter sp.]